MYLPSTFQYFALSLQNRKLAREAKKGSQEKVKVKKDQRKFLLNFFGKLAPRKYRNDDADNNPNAESQLSVIENFASEGGVSVAPKTSAGETSGGKSSGGSGNVPAERVSGGGGSGSVSGGGPGGGSGSPPGGGSRGGGLGSSGTGNGGGSSGGGGGDRGNSGDDPPGPSKDSEKSNEESTDEEESNVEDDGGHFEVHPGRRQNSVSIYQILPERPTPNHLYNIMDQGHLQVQDGQNWNNDKTFNKTSSKMRKFLSWNSRNVRGFMRKGKNQDPVAFNNLQLEKRFWCVHRNQGCKSVKYITEKRKVLTSNSSVRGVIYKHVHSNHPGQTKLPSSSNKNVSLDETEAPEAPGSVSCKNVPKERGIVVASGGKDHHSINENDSNDDPKASGCIEQSKEEAQYPNNSSGQDNIVVEDLGSDLEEDQRSQPSELFEKGPGMEAGEGTGEEAGEEAGKGPGERPEEESGVGPGDESGVVPGEVLGELLGEGPGEGLGKGPEEEPGEEPAEEPGEEPGVESVWAGGEVSKSQITERRQPRVESWGGTDGRASSDAQASSSGLGDAKEGGGVTDHGVVASPGAPMSSGDHIATDKGKRADNLPASIVKELLKPWSQEDDFSQENVMNSGNKGANISSVKDQGPKRMNDSDISPQKYKEYLNKLKIINGDNDDDISVRAFKSLSLKIKLNRDPFKMDEKTPADDQCFFHTIIQQGAREEIFSRYPQELKQIVKSGNVQKVRRYIVDNMEKNETNQDLVQFRNNYIKLQKTIPEYPTWKSLCNTMKSASEWADENVVQAAAYLIGMDIAVTSMDCRKGEINMFRKDMSTADTDNLSSPCLIIGKNLFSFNVLNSAKDVIFTYHNFSDI